MNDLTSDQRTVLQAFSRALDRGAHVLTEHPDLFWQQLYNRLQWEGKGVEQALASELARRIAPGSKPWIRMCTPFLESRGLVRTLIGAGCAVSPDGSWIISRSSEGLKLWDTSNWQELHTIKGASGQFAIGPNGQCIYSASADGLKVWDTSNGQELRTIIGPSGEFAVSPDGHWIFANGSIWDAEDGQELRRIKGASGRCMFSPDGRWIISAPSFSRSVCLWDAFTGELVRKLKLPLPSLLDDSDRHGVTACCFSPDGCSIVAADDGTLYVWDSATGEKRLTLHGHTDLVFACQFSPDGRLIASASDDKTVRIWEAATGRIFRLLEGHTDWVMECAFSPDGRWLVSADRDYALRVWDIVSDQEPWKSHRHPHRDRVRTCVFSPDGRWIASAGGDYEVRVWDATSGDLVRTLNEHTEREVTECAFSPDGRWMVSSGWDGTLRVWDAATGQLLSTIEGAHRGSGYSASGYSLDGRSIANPVNASAFSPDGCFFVSTGKDRIVRSWDAAKGDLLRTMEGHKAPVWGCAVSPDGTKIVSASEDQTLKIWDAASGRELRTLIGHRSIVEACAFSPDARWIVSSGFDGTVRLWDAATGEEIHVLRGHTDVVGACAFSPDGHLILSASTDRAVQVWEPASGKRLAKLLLPGPLDSIGVHPWLNRAVCGDAGGAMYRLELAGIEYGPIIVTAANGKQGLVVRCPACQQEHPVRQEQLDTELTCFTLGCGLHLRVNPFTIQRPHSGKQQPAASIKKPAEEKRNWLLGLLKKR